MVFLYMAPEMQETPQPAGTPGCEGSRILSGAVVRGAAGALAYFNVGARPQAQGAGVREPCGIHPPREKRNKERKKGQPP
jgi:hypothetical protein